MTYADNPDDLPCEGCGRMVHLHDRPVCDHAVVACEDCGHEKACRDCRHNAELLAGLPTGFPHDLDPAPHIAAKALYDAEMKQWREESGFDATTNSRRHT